MRRPASLALLLAAVAVAQPTPANAPPAGKPDPGGLSVLVFSKTAGFRHSSIPDGVACFGELARQHGFTIYATEDAATFTPSALREIDVVVFLNTTGDVLDEGQQQAFEAWFRAGGGFLGVHSAADTEYDWPWYGRLVGAWFKSHPAIQPARLIIADPTHPATAHMAAAEPGGGTSVWTRTDEWYDFRAAPAPEVRRLLRLDPASYEGGSIGDDRTAEREHPIAWCHEFDGGRAIYTGGGHTEASYAEPEFRRHLLGALRWAGGVAD